ncbi:MAG: tRNA (mo5U34)-methyltransferase [Candidatus Heimdallarchaeota archaeon LC_3]|nr:MAG: tRNA (mo5U34)-methyltransferase [Candidatus Heimdallarchaeota archaeon LC_3]
MKILNEHELIEENEYNFSDQNPLHFYSSEYWKARKSIAKNFIKKSLSPIINKMTDINSIADLGCGTGWFGRYLAKEYNATELYCLDSNSMQLQQAKLLNHKLKEIKKHHILLNLGIDPLPMNKSSLDIILMINAIYYLDKEQKLSLFKEIRRCLKPEGYFIFSIENTLYWRNTHPFFPPFPFFWHFPKLITEKILIQKGYSRKIPKYRLHYHHSFLGYKRLLKKAKAKSVTCLLSPTLEYTIPLDDHLSFPFHQSKDSNLIYRDSTKIRFLNHFKNYNTRLIGDRLFSGFSKLLIKSKMPFLPMYFSPRQLLVVRF